MCPPARSGPRVGRRVGLVAFGAIARQTGRFARAFGMDVVHHSRSSGLPWDELLERSEFLGRNYLDQSVTLDFGGEEAPSPPDLIPRFIRASEWSPVEDGVKQRVKALEAFLTDVYSAGALFDDGVMPRDVVTSSHHLHRAVHGKAPSTVLSRPAASAERSFCHISV